MSRILSLLFFCYLAVFVTAVPASSDQTLLSSSEPRIASGWEWSDCAGTPNDIIEIKSLSVSPDPPQPGKNLTVTASGYVSNTIKKGAIADVTVKLGLIKLLSKSFDICDEAAKANVSIQCPVEPGDYTVVQSVALPKEIPPAKFTVEVRAYNDDDANLMCANIKVDFMPSLFKL